MKEDILEQLVDDYLQFRGYFTRHNVKFRPRSDAVDFVRSQDSNHSDIDVLGFDPHLSGPDCIWVVSCKSWQAGFSVAAKIKEIDDNKVRSGREVWKAFRELVVPKWTDAFFEAVQRETGSTTFTYVTAVTAIRGDATLWEHHPRFQQALRGNPIKLLSAATIFSEIADALGTTVASSSLGRTFQLLKASGYLNSTERGASHLLRSDS